MAVCEKCWSEAYRLAQSSVATQTHFYFRLITNHQTICTGCRAHNHDAKLKYRYFEGGILDGTEDESNSDS